MKEIIDTIWDKFIDVNQLLKQQWFTDIFEFIEEEYKIKRVCPEKHNIFNMFRQMTPDEIRVMLVFQDPYATLRKGVPVSNGIGLAANYCTPSLKNFYQSMEIIGKDDYSMRYLLNQGIFSINMFLTVEHEKPMSHAPYNKSYKGRPLRWDLFTQHYIKKLSEKYDIIYLLFGQEAKKLENYIIKGNVLKTVHPSPRGFVYKNSEKNIFLETNRILKEKNQTEIQWKESIIN